MNHSAISDGSCLYRDMADSDMADSDMADSDMADEKYSFMLSIKRECWQANFMNL